MTYRIVAVAMGAQAGNYEIDKTADLKDAGAKKVRRYLHGLVTGLSRRGYKLGPDYVIDFHLTNEPGLLLAPTFRDRDGENPDVIFCMSTRVVRAAGAIQLGATVPIVGIVSDPQGEGFDQAPYCGASANRTLTAGDGFNNFRRAVPSLTRIYILGDNNNAVSQRARGNIAPGAFPVTDINVTDLANLGSILTSALPPRPDTTQPCTNGLLVLPLDTFLGRAHRIIEIVQEIKHLAAFFLVPDFVRGNEKSAIGGYGVPQKRCGMMMAEQVHHIFANNGQFPPGRPRWLFAQEYDFELATSAPAAAKYNITLGEDIPAPEE